MGCTISKSYAEKQTNFPIIHEFEAHDDGKKTYKKPVDDEFSVRQSRVITDINVTSRYEIKSVIGFGTFSDVFFAEEKTSKYPYAIKVLELRSLKTKELFQAESEIMKRISHKNIVKFKEVITSPDRAYIIMELATGGDLFDKIHSNDHLKETEVIRITGMLLDAVIYLHSKGITHRDLKPENVLFYKPGVNSRVIITDFGFARYFDSNSVLSTYCGTAQYLSPEVTQQKTYTHKCDIWSIGVMVYVMLSGQLPFKGRNVQLLRKQIIAQQHSYKREIWRRISDQAKDFINCALEKDPDKRFTALEASQHLWFKKPNTESFMRTKRSTVNGQVMSIGGSTGQSESSGRKYQPHFTNVLSYTSSDVDNESSEIECTETIEQTHPSPRLDIKSNTGVDKEHHNYYNNEHLIRKISCKKHSLGGPTIVLPPAMDRISKADLDSTDTSTTTSMYEGASHQATDGTEVSNNIIHVQQKRCTMESSNDSNSDSNETLNNCTKERPIPNNYNNRKVSLAQTVRFSKENPGFHLNNYNNNSTYKTNHNINNRSRHLSNRSTYQSVKHDTTRSARLSESNLLPDIDVDGHVCYGPRTLYKKDELQKIGIEKWLSNINQEKRFSVVEKHNLPQVREQRYSHSSNHNKLQCT